MAIYFVFGWSVFSCFSVSFTICLYISKQRIQFYTKASLLAWITEMMLLFTFLYIRGNIKLLFHFVTIRGTFSIVFFTFPVSCLMGKYFSSSLGYLLFYAK